MKFLIAGFGSIGRRHFRNLLTLGERDIVFLRSKRSTLSDDEIADFYRAQRYPRLPRR
jgi:glyceraldehyde-3-phosphate dehydrogenase/erythrose-4-phosphate dehydrogenase